MPPVANIFREYSCTCAKVSLVPRPLLPPPFFLARKAAVAEVGWERDYRIAGKFHEIEVSHFHDLIQFAKVYLRNR